MIAGGGLNHQYHKQHCPQGQPPIDQPPAKYADATEDWKGTTLASDFIPRELKK